MNLTMMTDLYQLTMMQAYYKKKMHKKTAVFDLYFRKNNFNYCIYAGLEQAIEYIQKLKFYDNDINYLKSLNIFDEDFLNYLKDFKFSGEIYSMNEGEVVFANEPMLYVKAPLIEAQFVETTLLNIIGFQTLIATKAARLNFAAKNKEVVEFGMRRAHGACAAIYGARAAIIGGCSSTSNVQAAKMFELDAIGTHAHSFVMCFENEKEAFEAYRETYPNNCLLLVDTYDTLEGVKNAIKIFRKIKNENVTYGIRLDSGDLAFLSRKAREMLDKAGFENAKIYASNDLDEYVIESLEEQRAKIDVYCVGTKLITSFDYPSLGAVYKLVALEEKNEMVGKMKISESSIKMTLPCEKQVYRIYKHGKAFADLIAKHDEEEFSSTLTLIHPIERWKQSTIDNYEKRPLLHKVYSNGQKLYRHKNVYIIAKQSKKELSKFWDEYKRLYYPHVYKVDLSDNLYEMRQNLLKK